MSESKNFEILSQPFQIGKLPIKNRFVIPYFANSQHAAYRGLTNFVHT